MKFSIRDLLWLTVVIALTVAWWLDHWRQGAENRKINGFVEFYERQLITTRTNGFALPPGRVIPGTVNMKGQ